MFLPKLPHNVIFIGAHPDDETVMAGGTLAMLHQHGVPTHIACVTDGRGGEAGGVAEARTPAARAVVREEELRCAAAALGARSVTPLCYEDPAIGPGKELFGFAADEDYLVGQLADVIWVRGADVVLTHGSDGEYGHPAHVQVHHAVLRAVQERLQGVAVYGVAARVPGVEDRLWNQSDPAHLALDITPWIEPKHAAMECHRTQHPLFKRRRKLATVREAIRTVESFHRHWPPLSPGKQPKDSFARLMAYAGGGQPARAE
jgi:N-acetylglucosamine malate deacetylase 2